MRIILKLLNGLLGKPGKSGKDRICDIEVVFDLGSECPRFIDYLYITIGSLCLPLISNRVGKRFLSWVIEWRLCWFKINLAALSLVL